MAEPHTLGTLHWHTLRYPEWMPVPIVNRSTTTEIDPPFRTGPCWILRVPLTRTALVAGRWRERLDEPEAWQRALSMRVVEDNGAGFEDDLV
jgi:hypothetical protein